MLAVSDDPSLVAPKDRRNFKWRYIIQCPRAASAPRRYTVTYCSDGPKLARVERLNAKFSWLQDYRPDVQQPSVTVDLMAEGHENRGCKVFVACGMAYNH